MLLLTLYFILTRIRRRGCLARAGSRGRLRRPLLLLHGAVLFLLVVPTALLCHRWWRLRHVEVGLEIPELADLLRLALSLSGLAGPGLGLATALLVACKTIQKLDKS